MKKILLTALVFLMILSCNSSQAAKKKKSDSGKLTSSRIDSMLENNRPFAAYQLIISDENGSSELDYDSQAEKSRVLDYIKDQFFRYKAEKDFFAAESVLGSLERLGLAGVVPEEIKMDEILLESIESEYGKKNYFAALKSFMLYMQMVNPSEELLKRYADLAVEVNNNFYLRQIMEKMSARGLQVGTKYLDASAKTDSPAEMIKGTVTIWVDKGIKVESGVGKPDRVIGSGFFIDPRGYLITNYHVIESEVNPEYEGYSRLYIRLSDSVGTRVPARVIGWDPLFDIALLKTEIIPEYIFSFSENRRFQIGDRIYAIGSPGGLENTLTSGIISSRSRKFLQIGDAMQVDVPINPGNSGGPLLNEKGELIAVVFAGIEQFEGINFAIPAHWIADIVPELYRGGEVSHSWIGSVMYEKGGTIEILYNVPGEAAERAGLKKGDVIKSINGKATGNLIEAHKILMSMKNDTVIDVSYTRNGNQYNTFLALGSRKVKSFDLALKRDSMKNLVLPLFGMDIEPYGNYLFRESYLVKNIYEGSIADETGLSVNDPLVIKGWKYDLKKRFALLRIEVKKRKAGFMESNIQLLTSIDSNNLL